KAAVAFRAPPDRPDSRKQAAPVLNQDVDKKTGEQRERDANHSLSDDRFDQIVNPFNNPLDNRLSAAGNECRFINSETEYRDEDHGNHPARDHTVRDRESLAKHSRTGRLE